MSENQVDNFIMQTRQMVDRYYQEAFTEAIREIGCSEDIFEPLDNSFVTLKEEFLESEQAVSMVKRLAASPLVKRIYVENHGLDESADTEIQPYGWFGSCEGETLKTINGTATSTSPYKGNNVMVGVSEASNGIANAAFFSEHYANLNFAALSSGSVTDHATKVAAIVAAIAPNCTLRSYPLTAEEDLISLGVNIINCSYRKINSDKTSFNPGQYCYYDARIGDRVKNDYVTYVIAAGNDGARVSCPANAANAITVGATDNNGTTKASYSNYDTLMEMDKPTVVANGAPHVPFLNDAFHTDFGTSYAAPMVTGAIAAMLSKKPLLKHSQEMQIALLMANANLTKMGGNYTLKLSGMSDYFGAGMLDIDNMMANINNVYGQVVTSVPSTGIVAEYTINVPSSAVGKMLRSALFTMNSDYANRNTTSFSAPDIPTYSLISYFNGQQLDTSYAGGSRNCLTGFAPINQAGTYTIRIIRETTAVEEPERIACIQYTG